MGSDLAARAVLASWSFDAGVVGVLGTSGAIYAAGWRRVRRLVRRDNDWNRIWCFLAGLGAILVALESPLDAFDQLFLAAHMTQHLLLMMVAPPLILLGHPAVPLLRGLPRSFVKEGLGPFLWWPALRRILHFVTSPPAALVLLALSTLLWHLPYFYELALARPGWHAAQHACFFWTGIGFWWTVMEPRRGWPRWTVIPYLLMADVVNTVLAALLVFSDRLLYPSYGDLRDQVLAGAIMWVPGSLVYLVTAMAIGMRLLSPRTPETARRRLRGIQKENPIPIIALRRLAQAALLGLAIAVVADGISGPQTAPLNLAGWLPWIQWRALSLMALLVTGNLFCMSCPFVLTRDMVRKILPRPKLKWPRRLRNKWMPAMLFVGYLCAYEAFALWDSPRLTAWIIVGYFTGAIAVDGLFRGASFCKYCCPIGQFHFVASLVSPRELKIRRLETCRTCRTYDCIRGNSGARGCELELFQPKKLGNLDCTLCLDCVKACPQGNVALLPAMPAATLIQDAYRSSIGRLSKRTDWTVLALVVVFGAFVNAAAMTAPVLMGEHAWHSRWGSMSLATGGFVLAGLLAGSVLAGLARAFTAAAGRDKDWQRFAMALVPLGIAMWAAHMFFHFLAAWNPGWMRPLQICLLDGGLLLSLFVIWKIATQGVSRAAVAAPWFALAGTLYGAGVWIFFQPMQMRGMVH